MRACTTRLTPGRRACAWRGGPALYRYCAERGIDHRRTGKLLVATDGGRAGHAGEAGRGSRARIA